MDKYDKRQYRFRLNDDTVDYLQKYAIDNSLSHESPSLALEEIVSQHEEMSNNKFDVNYMADIVSHEVTNSLNLVLQKSLLKDVNRIRLGTNNADRNTQILIELLQGFMQFDNVDAIFTTEMNKPEFLDEAEKLIQKRISELKQKKSSSKKYTKEN